MRVFSNLGQMRTRDACELTSERLYESFTYYDVEQCHKQCTHFTRAISVILGDEWKSLSSEERKVYILEAKSLAEEHKRIYPDCWKRKRTTQVKEEYISQQLNLTLFRSFTTSYDLTKSTQFSSRQTTFKNMHYLSVIKLYICLV